MNEPRQADSLFQPEDQPAPAALEPIYIHLALTDPEVVAAVGEYPAGQARTEFVNTCVKIGVLSLRAAKGVVDGDAIRTAGDHLIGQLSERLTGYREALEDKVSTTLGHYFDPASGLFQVRVENLTKADGDLARVIQAQVGAAQAELDKTFERFLGENSAFLALLEPGEGNRLLAALRATVDEVARTEKDAIIAQFTLDDPQSALSRLVRELTASHGEVGKALKEQIDEVIKEFSLDNEGGALSRLVGRVEEAQTAISQEFSLDNDESALSRMRRGLQDQLNDLTNRQATFQQEVLAQLTAMTTRREAEAKSTTHGAVFEEAVGEYLRALGTPAGDIVEASGLTTGTVRSSKVGDYVVTLPPDSAAAGARIVVEAKEDKSYTLKASLEEADVARRNRSSGVCLFVHSARTAPARSFCESRRRLKIPAAISRPSWRNSAAPGNWPRRGFGRPRNAPCWRLTVNGLWRFAYRKTWNMPATAPSRPPSDNATKRTHCRTSLGDCANRTVSSRVTCRRSRRRETG